MSKKDINKVMFSSWNDKWATPQDYFDKINEKYNFTLDACAAEDSFKCKNYYTEEINALKQDWNWRVFCNPPYSELRVWAEKCHFEINNNPKCELIAFLIPARTDTIAFHEYMYKKDNVEIDFIKGRLIFWTEWYWEYLWNNEYIDDWKWWKKLNTLYWKKWKKNSAPFPSMLVVFKNKNFKK